MIKEQAYGKKLTDSLGESEIFIDFQQRLSRAAQVDRPVLIIGERGSGKEMAASRLHFLSARWDQPLVTINCAALPQSLIETELFGHESGAFTGATKARKGRFEEASHGTLFLDEIGLIPLEVQEKILRVVEYGTYERVGSSKTHEVDVRIIGATNADLQKLCREGSFSFEVLFLPPLRERREDILLLASHFASRMAYEIGRKTVPQFSEDVIEHLYSYPWPGNIRELKNTIERAVYRTDEEIIDSITLNPFESPFEPISEDREQLAADVMRRQSEEDVLDETALPGDNASAEKLATEKLSAEEHIRRAVYAMRPNEFQEKREQFELFVVGRALDEAGGSQKQAAQIMGLTYDQFRGLYRKYRDQLPQ